MEKLRRFINDHPRESAGFAGILLLFALVSTLDRMFRPRQEPRELSWSIAAPQATPLEDGAKPGALRLTFTLSAARLEDLGRPVRAGVQLMPQQRGAWRWETERELVFAPDEDWPAGTSYTVRLDPAIFPKHLRLDSIQERFMTAPFSAHIDSAEFFVDPRDPKRKIIAATFRFTHPVDQEAFEKRLSLSWLTRKKGLFERARPQPFTVTYDKYFGKAFLVSAPVGIPVEDSPVELKLAAGAVPRRGGPAAVERTSQILVPGMFNYFQFKNARSILVRNDKLEPEQVLLLEASAGIDEKGLVQSVQAWALPEDRWYSAQEVGASTLARSLPITLSPIAAEREYPTEQSFKYRAPSAPRSRRTRQTQLFVRVPRGLSAYGGYILAKDFEAVIEVPLYPRELKILHDGSLMRLSGDKKLSLYALGEEAVRLEVGRVRSSQINHLASQTQGNFENPQFINWHFGADNITDRFEEVRPLARAEPDKMQFFSLDLGQRLQAPGAGVRNGLFFVRVEGWDALRQNATGSADTRFVLVTDLGVLVKENADKTRDVFVMSLGSGDPVAGAKVEALGLNGVPIASAHTDGAGRARLPDLSGFKREKAPSVYVIKHDEDVSFLPYNRQDRKLDFSRFDVGGISTEGREKELAAYLFSDRGLYRPGEAFNVGILVRPPAWSVNLEGIPLELSVQDPRGLEIHKRKFSLHSSGFEDFTYQTKENGLTGAYQVCVYIVKDNRRHALLGSISVRVEEFLPDRLRIAARFTEARTEGWVNPSGLKAVASLHTLFGTPAEGRRIAAKIRLSPGAPRFKGYSDYSFFDPSAAKKSFNERLEDAETDQNGEATLELGLERFAGTTYRVDLAMDGFEGGGGRGVTAQASILVSPRAYLVGLKADGALHYVQRWSTRTVHAVALGPAGTPLPKMELAAHLIEERWVSALVRGEDGLYRYQSVKKELFVSSNTASLPGFIRLVTDQPGDCVLVIKDEAGLELNRLSYKIAGHGNLSRSLDKNAELKLALEKQDYAPGEVAELHIKAPYAGSGLITVERDKVFSHKWFTATTAASTQTIRIPEGVEGNAYITVSFLRSPQSREIFMSPLSYGVAPFTVARARRELPLTLQAPERLKPGETVKIRFKTARPSRIAVFAADEGILQAAGWTLPDPLAHFFRKRALEVRTYQLLDLLMPEYRMSMAVMAPGGDQDGWEAVGKNLNPFKRRRDKPAVFWSGIVDAGPEWKEVSFPIPDSFNGTLKISAVAAEPNSIGVAQTKTLVRSDIVLTPNHPMFVAPDDEFEASVSVANGVEGSGEKAPIRVTLKPTEHLQILGEREKTVPVGENREATVLFRLKARPALGAATLRFEASLASSTVQRVVSLSVRPAMPYIVTLQTGHAKSGKTALPTPRRMYPAYRLNEASVSPLPLALAKGLIQYLQKYPYGCTEQIVSQAFPAIILRHRPAFGYAPEVVETNLNHVIQTLRERQNAEGAFGFWAANSHVSEFQAVYAAHFLTEAREKGYAVPPELLAKNLAFLMRVATSAPGISAPPRVQAYAIYVLTRNGHATAPLINGLIDRLNREEGAGWKKELTGAYLAAASSMHRLDAQADALIRQAASGVSFIPDYLWFYDTGIHEAQLMYLLARHFPARMRSLDADAVLKLVEPLMKGEYNTLSSAYTILALDAYVDAAGEVKPDEARLAELLEGGGEKALVVPPELFSKTAFSPQTNAVSFENRSSRRLFYQTNQSGFDLKLPKEPVRNKLEITREFLDAKGNTATATTLGTELSARIRFRTLLAENMPNVAVVDLLPGGLEPILERRAPPAPCSPSEEDEDVCHAGEETADWRPDYEDRREDRVIFFASAHGDIRELTYRVKAVARGRFASPPPFAQSMYDNAAQALGPSGSFTVE